MEKSTLLLSQYWKNKHFDCATKLISYFVGTNNSFADCRLNFLTVLFGLMDEINPWINDRIMN